MKIIIKDVFLVLIFILLLTNTYGQNFNVTKSSQYFDSIYGADNLLINGRIYMFPNYKAEGNPFFFGKDINYCTIFLNAKEYINIPTLYNIETDKLIIINKINNNRLFIEINNNSVDSFIISKYISKANKENSNLLLPDNFTDLNFEYKKKFINTDYLGFCEVIYRNKYVLLRKYFKKFSDNISKDSPYGTYNKQKQTLYIEKGDTIININIKRKFLNTFSTHKKELKNFMKETGINYKKAKEIELVKLIQFCEKY